MPLSHSRWLCIILPTLIGASPQKTSPTLPKPSLPATLYHDVPACAQPCLHSRLAEQFPFACTAPVNLGCLCSRYSFDGRSLGEVALGCIYASCSTYQGAASAYNVCLGERYAVAPTLTALTIVAKSSSAVISTTSVHTVATTHSIATTISSSKSVSTSRPQTTLTDSVVADSVSSISVPTSTQQQGTTSPLAAATSAATSAAASRTMTPAQIAGLAVAAGAAFIIAIGLMALSVFLRRRRERKRGLQVNEKEGLSPLSPTSRASSMEFPPSFAPAEPLPLPPVRPIAPPAPVLRNPNERAAIRPINKIGLQPLKLQTDATVNTASQSKASDAGLKPLRPILRSTAAPSNNASSSSTPFDQIGLAISAEPPLLPPKDPPQQRPGLSRRNAEVSQRPDSVMTQTTVFEEDEIRRESKLLPTPPVPIPPIRTFQPSRPPPLLNNNTQPTMAEAQIRSLPQQPELFLDIPIRHSKSLPLVVDSTRSEKEPQLSSQNRTSEYNPTSAGTTVSELSNGGDILDYYFTRGNSKRSLRAKLKRSSSMVSRAESKASTNARDSISSQTSFETADPNDPTPEDDDVDKRLNGRELSPVAESPIKKLRYKVPRASNQLVPRSSKNTPNQVSQGSPRRLPESSSLAVKRKGEQGALTLGSSSRTGSPDTRAMTDIRTFRQHLRSSSVETWSPVRTSERSTRTQSGLWPKSPAMYEPDVVRPLRIRSKAPFQPPITEMEALKSPAWVPRLTPTRQGDDLLISVTYSKPGR